MPVLNWQDGPIGGRGGTPAPVSGERGMGIIVQFPEGHRPVNGGRYVGANSEPAHVIILPVVRIERNPDLPSDGMDGGGSAAAGRRRRRRSSRS